ERVLAECLRVMPDDAPDRLLFVRSANEALSRLKTEGHAAAFLLSPIDAQSVVTRAKAGGLLPQKTTDFYPKVLTRLGMNLLGDDAERIAAPSGPGAPARESGAAGGSRDGMTTKGDAP